MPRSAKPSSRFAGSANAEAARYGIACCGHVFVGGACVQSSRKAADDVSREPSRDGRTGLPHVLVACERSADTLLRHGTSVAPPTLARRLANLLAKGHPVDLDRLPGTVVLLQPEVPASVARGGPAADSLPGPPPMLSGRPFTTSSAGS